VHTVGKHEVLPRVTESYKSDKSDRSDKSDKRDKGSWVYLSPCLQYTDDPCSMIPHLQEEGATRGEEGKGGRKRGPGKESQGKGVTGELCLPTNPGEQGRVGASAAVLGVVWCLFVCFFFSELTFSGWQDPRGVGC